MIVITTPLAVMGLFAIVYLGSLFANLSRRLSAVTKMTDYHRWFMVANVFVSIAAASQVMRGTAALAPQLAPPILLKSWFALATFHIPLAIGVTLDLVLTWYYWGWTLKEKVEWDTDGR
ncbi:MAG: hypothetical protein DRI79_05530 [Chloroflexi bacterium]|nr:MAG: hypothetical protein DRI80_06810 [Chloroflexota bacterium]RLC90152.1 MAG: hypothetical protein DRI79_05530 [Chloroflexota bacterium]HEY68853.1 hypothetical protein [Thermoflexia bacterium]